MKKLLAGTLIAMMALAMYAGAAVAAGPSGGTGPWIED